MRIHLVAIGGTGMAPLACLLRELGHQVQGSDHTLYPPMSDLIAQAGIVPFVGFDAAHLEPRPDLVIIGNAVPRDNVEARATEELDLPRMSMPAALARFVLRDRLPFVVAGTHGKTTTTSILAWVLDRCGAEPGFLIGGAPIGFASSFRLGRGLPFVLEGDEYNAAYFDRGAKFHHYGAQTLLLTNVEHDHLDLYPSWTDFEEAFRRLIANLPAQGSLVVCYDDPVARELAQEAPCPTISYGLDREDVDLRAVDVQADGTGTRFRILFDDQEIEARLSMWGRHNVSNALGAWAAARTAGATPDAIAAALAGFSGVQRRLESIGSARNVTVIDDFAHHPSEVAASLEALRERFPDRRLLALFEPRSLTAARAEFLQPYADALAKADVTLLAPAFHRHRLPEDEALDCVLLADELRRRHRRRAEAAESIDDLLARTLGEVRPGDVVVTMSSGSFDNLARRLLETLEIQPPPLDR